MNRLWSQKNCDIFYHFLLHLRRKTSIISNSEFEYQAGSTFFCVYSKTHQTAQPSRNLPVCWRQCLLFTFKGQMSCLRKFYERTPTIFRFSAKHLRFKGFWGFWVKFFSFLKNHKTTLVGARFWHSSITTTRAFVLANISKKQNIMR